jgi:hypothetical protein
MIVYRPYDNTITLVLVSGVMALWMFMMIIPLEKAIEHSQEYEKSIISLSRVEPFQRSSQIFGNAKVGDEVWSSQYGWGRIIIIDEKWYHIPIIVKFDEARLKSGYNFSGVGGTLEQTLFWSKDGK